MELEPYQSRTPRPESTWPDVEHQIAVRMKLETGRALADQIENIRKRSATLLGVSGIILALLAIRPISPTPAQAIVLFTACGALFAAVVLSAIVQAPSTADTGNVDDVDGLRLTAARRMRTLFAAYLCFASGVVLVGASFILSAVRAF